MLSWTVEKKMWPFFLKQQIRFELIFLRVLLCSHPSSRFTAVWCLPFIEQLRLIYSSCRTRQARTYTSTGEKKKKKAHPSSFIPSQRLVTLLISPPRFLLLAPAPCGHNGPSSEQTSAELNGSCEATARLISGLYFWWSPSFSAVAQL